MDSQTFSLQLNQSDLQDYLDCPRRFELNVLQEKSWPAAPTQPIAAVEHSIHQGNRFHQICQQYFAGISPSSIRNSLNDPDLLEMWDVFVPYANSLTGNQIFFEQLLHIPFNGHRLIAKFDLIVQMPEQYLIIDWKTSPKKPPLSVLSERVQTYLYPYIFTIAGPDLFNSGAIDPGTIKLIYWYPLSSDPEISFSYSSDEHLGVQTRLNHLIDQIEISFSNNSDFQLTSDLSKCQFCSYRSLCDRGSRPGNFELFSDLDEFEGDDLIMDIEQVSELEY